MGLAILFFSMFVTSLVPSHKILLHIVAATAAIAAIWHIWIVTTQPDPPVLLFWFVYYTVAVLWFIYYGVCLRYR